MTSMLPLFIIIKHPETSYSHYPLWHIIYQFSSVQSLSHVWLFATPWTAAHQASHHQLPELTQTHVHRVGDAIQPSHPLSSPSPPTFSLSQHQGPFKWVSSSHQVAKVLELHFQHQSFQWILRTDWLVGSPCSPRDSQRVRHNWATELNWIKLITWTTALSNSMKLWAMPCRATQDGRVMVESSDKMWSTWKGNGKPLQYSCFENPMNSIKRQK